MFLFAKDKMSLLEEEKMETLLMSIKELSRLEVIQRLLDRRMYLDRFDNQLV